MTDTPQPLTLPEVETGDDRPDTPQTETPHEVPAELPPSTDGGDFGATLPPNVRSMRNAQRRVIE